MNSRQLDNDNCEIVPEFQRHYRLDLSQAQSLIYLIRYAKRINETVIPHSLG